MDMDCVHIAIWGMTPNPGGTEAFIMNLYRNIDRNKVQFDFILKHDEPKIAFEDEIEQLGGRIYRIIYSAEENYIKNKTCLIAFFKEHSEIKGIHINCTFPYIYPLLQAKKAGLNLRIMHSHCVQSDPPRNIIKRIYTALRKPISNYQIATVPTNRFACSAEAGRWMFCNSDFEIVNNGIDTNHFDYSYEKRMLMREKLKLNNKFVVGFVGRLSPEKNPIFLIEVFYQYYKINSNCILLIIGQGSLEFEIKEKIKEYNLDNNVIFTGVVNDCADYYQAMDCFLLPSNFEGLGVVLIEAQCSGLHCIASNNVPKSANLTDNVSFLETDSAREWAQKIAEIENSGFIRSSQQNVIKEKGFDSKKLASRLQNIYLSET